MKLHLPRRRNALACCLWLVCGTLAPLLAMDTDAVFEASLKSMQERQGKLEELLKAKKIGEKLNGTLAAVSTDGLGDDQAFIDAENKDRQAVYAAIASLSSDGTGAVAVAKQRAASYLPRLSKGILREITGKPGWSDGMTPAERIAGFTLKLISSPGPTIMAGKPFDVQAQFLDAEGKPAISPDLEGKEVSIAISPPTKLSGVLTTTVTNGTLKWPQLRVPDPVAKVLLTVTCTGDLAGKTVEIPSFQVTEKQPDASEITALLPGLERKLSIFLQDPPGTARNTNLINIANQLERLIAAINLMQPPDEALRAKLKELHSKTSLGSAQ